MSSSTPIKFGEPQWQMMEISKIRRSRSFSEERDPKRLSEIDARIAREGDCETSKKIRESAWDGKQELKEFEASILYRANDIVFKMVADIGEPDPGVDISLSNDERHDEAYPVINWDAQGDAAVLQALKEENWRGTYIGNETDKIGIARKIIRQLARGLAADMGVPALRLLADVEVDEYSELPDIQGNEVLDEIMECFDDSLKSSLKRAEAESRQQDKNFSEMKNFLSEVFNVNPLFNKSSESTIDESPRLTREECVKLEKYGDEDSLAAWIMHLDGKNDKLFVEAMKKVLKDYPKFWISEKSPIETSLWGYLPYARDKKLVKEILDKSRELAKNGKKSKKCPLTIDDLKGKHDLPTDPQ